MSVRPFIRPFIHPPLEAPWRLAIKRLAQVFSVLSLVLSGLGQLLRGQGQPLRSLGQPQRSLGARLRTLKSLSQPLNSPSHPPRGLQGVRTDERTYRFRLYSTGLCPLRFPPGPLPKNGILPFFTLFCHLGVHPQPLHFQQFILSLGINLKTVLIT